MIATTLKSKKYIYNLSSSLFDMTCRGVPAGLARAMNAAWAHRAAGLVAVLCFLTLLRAADVRSEGTKLRVPLLGAAANPLVQPVDISSNTHTGACVQHQQMAGYAGQAWHLKA